MFDEPVMLININQRYEEGMSQKEIYLAVRDSWKANLYRASHYGVVCAVYGKKIVGVFVVNEWFVSPQNAERIEFNGNIAPDGILKKYLGRDLSDHLEWGSQNPIRYEPCNDCKRSAIVVD